MAIHWTLIIEIWWYYTNFFFPHVWQFKSSKIIFKYHFLLFIFFSSYALKVSTNVFISFFMFSNFCPSPRRTISPGQKWWWTVLGVEILCSQWEGLACTHDGPCFFILGVGWGAAELFLVFSPCSQCVPLRFLKLFPKALSIAPQFYTIWFAQSSTVIYINWKVAYWGI